AFIVPLAPLFTAWPELRDVHDVFEQIRRRLGEEAQAALENKLHAAPFIPLHLEAGHIETKQRQEKDASRAEANRKMHTHGRAWKRFDQKNLLPPRGKFVLSADVGTGKTTFVEWLAAELVRRTHLLPVVMTCDEFERLAPKRLDDLVEALHLTDAFLP